jgi:hypothetical protein
VAPIVIKPEIVLNERSAGVGVIADTVSVNDGIHEHERSEKQQQQYSLEGS